MPAFKYKAVDQSGKHVSGVLYAENEQVLQENLRNMRLYLIDARETKPSQEIRLWKKVKRKDLLTFTVHLQTIVSAGIPIIQGLGDLIEQTNNQTFKKVLEDVRAAIQSGSTLSEALERHPKAFSNLFVSVIRAGEASGNLDSVLKDLIGFLEWQEEIISSIRQATIYPIIVLTAVTGLVILLMTFVFPRFSIIFEKANVPLPLPTRIVMAVSHLLVHDWIYLIAILAVIIVLFQIFKKTDTGRHVVDNLKLKIPVFGKLILKINLSRFSHYLGTLIKAGIDITQALRIVEKVIGNVILSDIIRVVRARVQAGEFMSDTLKEYPQFPPLVVRMISIGETSGNLEETLGKVSSYYDREVPVTIKKVFAIFEPLVIVFLASIVLLMALSMFLPLYQMMGVIAK